MSDSNPFHILFVITAICLMITATMAIVAPSLGVPVPSAPTFPTLKGVGSGSSDGVSVSQNASSYGESGNSSNIGGWIDSGGRLIVDGSGHVVATESGNVVYGAHYGAQASWINDSGAYPLFKVSGVSGDTYTTTQSTGSWIYGGLGLDMVWNYLVFGVSIIAYFIYFLGYMIAMFGVFFTLISGVSPWLANAISLLITIIIIGAILTFIRGGAGSNK